MNRNNEAIRKVKSQDLFFAMLKSKHIVEPDKRTKATRQSQNKKAIKESSEN